MSRRGFTGKLLDPPNFIGPHLIKRMEELQELLIQHERPGVPWDEYLMEIICIGAGSSHTINRDRPVTDDFYQWHSGYVFKLSGNNHAIILWPKGQDWAKKDGTQADRALCLHATREARQAELVQLVNNLVESAARLEKAMKVSLATGALETAEDTEPVL